MKRILCTFPFLLLVFLLRAQSATPGFVILNPSAVRNITPFVQALNSNSLDRYRHADHRTVIHFREGINVELLSAREMLEAGLPVDLNQVNNTDVDRTRYEQFYLHSSGRIMISSNSIKKGQ